MSCIIKKVGNDKVAANHGQVWTTTSKVKHCQNPSIASPCAWLHMKCITYVCLHIIIICVYNFLDILRSSLHEPRYVSRSLLCVSKNCPQMAIQYFPHNTFHKIHFVSNSTFCLNPHFGHKTHFVSNSTFCIKHILFQKPTFWSQNTFCFK